MIVYPRGDRFAGRPISQKFQRKPNWREYFRFSRDCPDACDHIREFLLDELWSALSSIPRTSFQSDVVGHAVLLKCENDAPWIIPLVQDHWRIFLDETSFQDAPKRIIGMMIMEIILSTPSRWTATNVKDSAEAAKLYTPA